MVSSCDSVRDAVVPSLHDYLLLKLVGCWVQSSNDGNDEDHGFQSGEGAGTVQ